MRVWPVLLILMTACGTSVTTSPAEPTSDDQEVTEPDATPAEAVVEAAAVPPDARLDSGSDAPSEASPDAPAPDVAQDSADAQLDAPEAWVWWPRDSGREADAAETDADADATEPLVVPVDVRSGGPGMADHPHCLDPYVRDDVAVDVTLPTKFSFVTYEFDVAIKNTLTEYVTIGVCGSWTADGIAMTSVNFGSILGNKSSVEVVRHVSATFPTYQRFAAGQRVVLYIGQEEGQAHYTGTVTFR